MSTGSGNGSDGKIDIRWFFAVVGILIGILCFIAGKGGFSGLTAPAPVEQEEVISGPPA